MTLGSRIAIIRGGSLEQTGSPMDLYRRPVNAFVATFLGSPPMNLIDESRNGARVQLGIRPEDVGVSATAADGCQSARVVVVEPMGSETLLALDFRAQRLVARVGADRQFEPGQPVWICIPPERVLRFDAASGRRLER
jgi:ABC-type sugar transport system ATPase subunit